MKKLKRRKPLDRLSQLPDSLIFNIFEFLPMTDVIRTAILSHRWRNLWTAAPNLNFDKFLFDYGADKFRNFVNRVLLRWRGTRVHKFRVSCDDDRSYDLDELKDSLVADVDLWLRFAVDNGVEDLYLRYPSPLCIPQFLYSCSSSLKDLCLCTCGLAIDVNVRWDQLRSLTVNGCDGVNEVVIEQILCGSPLLESFALSSDIDGHCLSFRSSSLKELSIDNSMERCVEMRIWAPNLETLAILGAANSKLLLEDVSSLTRVTLGLSERFQRDSVGSPFLDILASIQQVESITLLDFPAEMIGTESICTLPNVKFLKLHGVIKHKDTIHLLEIFPNIKTLVLKVKMHINRFDAKRCREYKPDNPSGPFLTELTRVEITWNERNFSIFPLIETLLKYASKLEKIVFRVSGFNLPSPNSLILASQKLLTVQRSYPNVEFIFCEY